MHLKGCTEFYFPEDHVTFFFVYSVNPGGKGTTSQRGGEKGASTESREDGHPQETQVCWPAKARTQEYCFICFVLIYGI